MRTTMEEPMSPSKVKMKFEVKQPQIKIKKESVFTKMNKLLLVVLPPFICFALTTLFSSIATAAGKLTKLIWTKKDQDINDVIHRRRFEEYIQYLKVDSKELGYTNQVLFQQSKKSIAFYVPTYVTCKIKSIQDVSVQSLLGNISCAMILNIFYGDIPEEIIQKLESSIILQLNRGQAIKLQEDGLSIICKNDPKGKFLIFTIRKIFLSSLKVQTLWTPFEIVELIITITLNTVTILPKELKKKSQTSHYNEAKEYKVSFNCMRNSDEIPMSYAMDCVFGIYDLAQRKLETYSSKYSSYSEIMHNFDLHLQKIKQLNEKKKQTKKEKSTKQPKPQQQKEYEIQIDFDTLNVSQGLELYMTKKAVNKKESPKKVKYFQYNHFIVPLYTYPGNAIASIFIPLFLLALVSLAIFFQEPNLSGRVDAIATMVLGYIALIPSIKGQIAPSSQLTIVESVVYMETMCCLLCLYESFKIYYENSDADAQKYNFVWNQDIAYMICLFAHIGTFLFISGVYIVHKLIWEPSYNSEGKVVQESPKNNINKWINPYCDETFIKFNKEVQNGLYSEQERQSLLIKPFKIKKEKKQKKQDKKIEVEKKQLKIQLKKVQMKDEIQQNDGKDLYSSMLNTQFPQEKKNHFMDKFDLKTSIVSILDYDEYYEPDATLYGQI